jgi:hypothetical protein
VFRRHAVREEGRQSPGIEIAANPNVFYELGVRHPARPHATIPTFATVSELQYASAVLAVWLTVAM